MYDGPCGPPPASRHLAARTPAAGIIDPEREICRVDVARHNELVWAKTSKTARVLFARFNNSTRAIPQEETEAFLRLSWYR